jgi:hypothetical protein
MEMAGFALEDLRRNPHRIAQDFHVDRSTSALMRRT